MKICSSCKVNKNLSEFPPNKNNRDGFNKKCRDCYNQYMKFYYEKNKIKHLSRVSINNKIKLDEVRDYIYSFLLKNPCVDCGESNPVVLEFDHIDIETKNDSISNMIRKRVSIDKIAEEIVKCEVRCANCHKIRTAKQFGWYKYK